jgi:hypothetical protein
MLRLPRLAFSGGDTHLWTPLLDLSASFWHQSVVERATQRTTRSTTSAAVPTGRDGSRWIPKEWTVAEFAPVHKLTAFWAVKEVFFFCVALVYQNQPHSFFNACRNRRWYMAAALAARQSKTILARSGEAGRPFRQVV